MEPERTPHRGTPFTPAQIKLLETFADQAVIAIENVRLFQELKESLEQQTATSEILGVIASSPTDIQPVLDTVAINAARLCEAGDAQIRLVDDDGTRLIASFGTAPAPAFVRNSTRKPGWPGHFLIAQTVRVDDHRGSEEERISRYPRRNNQDLPEPAHVLSTPLLREGIAIGFIDIRRTEVRPFTEKQIALARNFC